MAIRRRSPVIEQALEQREPLALDEGESESFPGQSSAMAKANALSDELRALDESNDPRKIVRILKTSEQYRRYAGMFFYGGEDPKSVPTEDLLEMARTPDNAGDQIERAYRQRICSPLTGVRAFCVRCMGNSPRAVKECGATNCPLWPFRMGNNPFFGKLQNADAESTDEPIIEEPTPEEQT
jgi:hypothetical protein